MVRRYRKKRQRRKNDATACTPSAPKFRISVCWERSSKADTRMCYPLSIVLWTMQRDLGRTGCQMQRGAVATGVELFLL